MKQIILISSFIIIVIIIFSCEGITEPEPLPGRRDYTWEVDTLKIPFTYLYKMWGSSPNDVWAVGPGGGLDQTIWHYDGTDWKTDGISRGVAPRCIWGFSHNDIWIGGSGGKIWHFNGTNWSENLSYQNSDFTSVYFMNIWGDSPNDIYAIGYADSSNVRIGLMMHYNGTEWSRKHNQAKGYLVEIKRGERTSNKYYLMGHRILNGVQDTTKLFEFNGKKLTEIYSQPYSKETKSSVCKINNKIYFNIGDGLYTYENGTFKKFIQNNFPNTYTAMGRNENDIIWMMSDGLTHYNGSNFKYILNYENIRLKDGIVFDNTIFFVSHGDSYNYIFKGTLK